MKVGKLPVASIVLPLIFGAKFITSYFFPGKSATFDPMFTGMLEIALVAFVTYYLIMFLKWANNYRKAA